MAAVAAVAPVAFLSALPVSLPTTTTTNSLLPRPPSTTHCRTRARLPPVSLASASPASASSIPSPNIGAPPVIFVLGGPGCGKGTQCALLQKHYPLAQLCVGDLLRVEAAKPTSLGTTIASIMQRGEIVPGHVTMQLLNTHLQSLSSSVAAVLIDGFPRAMDQAREFERVFAQPHFVLFYRCQHDVMVSRLRRRAESSKRSDDVEPVFRRRLHTFENTTMPVIDYYRQRGLLRDIDAQTGSIQDVFDRTTPLFDPFVQ